MQPSNAIGLHPGSLGERDKPPAFRPNSEPAWRPAASSAPTECGAVVELAEGEGRTVDAPIDAETVPRSLIRRRRYEIDVSQC